MNYSLWLMPSGNFYSAAKRLIDLLSLQYRTPVFEPHVTLVGNIELSEREIIKKAEALARSMGKLEITLEGIANSEDYFEAIFLRVKENPELSEYSKLARRIFGKPEKEYHPHLSLAYGSIPLAEREQVCADLLKALEVISFSVDSFHLYNTQGEVQGWNRIRRFRFSSSSSGSRTI